MPNCSIWLIDGTLSDATTLDLSVPGSNCNEEVLHIPQGSKTGASPLDCLMSYIKVGRVSLSAEIQAV